MDLKNLIVSLGLIPLGLIIGQLLKVLEERKIIKETIPVEKYMFLIQNTSLLVLSPLVSIGAFWVMKIEDIKLITLPILGVSALVLGGLLGFVAAKAMKLERKQTGALFVSASFTNLGTFGGLICYVFFGEGSYVFVSLYKLFEQFYYFIIGYPIAKAHGSGNSNKSSILNLLFDPYILVVFFSIGIGIALNLSRIDRPEIYSMMNSILIPVSSLLLVTSVGFKMRITAVGNYVKECVTVLIIKFIAIPIIITSIAYFLGIGELADGIALKVILILSAMPPAFNSLIPPQIYDLDSDLANSSWLFNTGALVVIVPLLYIIEKTLL